MDEEQLAFLVDLGITDGQDNQPTIIHNAAFHTDDLDAYDSDCDDISSAKAVLMANLSSYSSVVLSKVPQHDTYQNDNMLNQSVQETSYFEQRQNVDLSSREKLIDSQMDDMIRNRCALKQEINSLKQNLSKQAKEKESLL
ncbi:hypothetical protein Tco_0644748 [Tanacetum coccineum]